jgi:hypothetical protein
MKYFRYGHCKDVYVKVGDKVNKGSLIATVGTGNGQWSAHLHFDVIVQKLTSWASYVFGMSKEQVKAIYIDPAPYVKTVMPEYDHLGYDYLEHANYGTAVVPKWCYHPGKDLNGAGAGNADIGDEIYSACNGEVIHCYDGLDKNGGWGKLIVIQEIIEVQKLDTEQTPKIEVVPIPVKIETPAPPVETPVAEPVIILKAETQTLPEEIKSEIVPIDWKFIASKIWIFIKSFLNKK